MWTRPSAFVCTLCRAVPRRAVLCYAVTHTGSLYSADGRW